MRLVGRILHAGRIDAPTAHLDVALSFWGGFDPAAGRVIDNAHPQVGLSLAGKVVVMPGSRGSAGTPGVLAESIRLGTGPAGFVLTKADINLVGGAMVAAALYEKVCPIVLLRPADFDRLDGVNRLAIESDGSVTW